MDWDIAEMYALIRWRAHHSILGQNVSIHYNNTFDMQDKGAI